MGGVYAAPPDDEMIWGALKSYEGTDIPHEVLGVAEARTRFPWLRVGDGESVIHEPGTGRLHPERAIVAHTDLARRYGAEIVGQLQLEPDVCRQRFPEPRQWLAGVDGSPHRFQEVHQHLLDGREIDVVLRPEVPIQSRRGHADVLGDDFEAGAVVAVLGEQDLSRVQNTRRALGGVTADVAGGGHGGSGAGHVAPRVGSDAVPETPAPGSRNAFLSSFPTLALGTSGTTVRETGSHLLAGLVPDQDRTADDAALLIVRTRGMRADDVVSLSLPEDPRAAAEAREYVRRQLARWHLDDLVMTTELLVSELIGNVIRHARGPVQLRCCAAHR
nr:hypothetical protein [Streptomyces sp. SP18BB07]